MEPVDAGPVDVRRAPLKHLDDERLGGAEARGEEVATGALEADVARQRVVALPGVVGEQLGWRRSDSRAADAYAPLALARLAAGRSSSAIRRAHRGQRSVRRRG